jgi:hypothetical protein
MTFGEYGRLERGPGGKGTDCDKAIGLDHHPFLLFLLLLDNLAIDATPESVEMLNRLFDWISDMGWNYGGGDYLGMRMKQGCPGSGSVIAKNRHQVDIIIFCDGRISEAIGFQYLDNLRHLHVGDSPVMIRDFDYNLGNAESLGDQERSHLRSGCGQIRLQRREFIGYLSGSAKSDGLAPLPGEIITHSFVARFCLNSGIFYFDYSLDPTNYLLLVSNR